METQIIRYTSIVLDENTSCTLHELCELCGQNKELIMEMINEGLIVPAGSFPRQWRFGFSEVYRVQTAHRLIRDLHVNIQTTSKQSSANDKYAASPLTRTIFPATSFSFALCNMPGEKS